MSVLRSIIDRLPTFIRRPLSYLKTYVYRLLYWRMVATEIRGQGPRDQRALRRAFLTAPLDSLKELNRWRNPMLRENATVESIGVGLFPVRAGSDDLYHVLPSHEKAVFDRIRLLLKPGDVFVDAGANIGFYTVVASRLVGPSGRVIAIEMMPDTAAILRTTVRINELDNVTIVENALSDKPGQAVRAAVAEGHYGQASISEDVRKAGKYEVEVKTTTLDAVLADTARIKLVKMDLEGAEIQALRGAAAAIERIENIIFEDWVGTVRMAEFWAALGFDVERLDGANGIAFRKPAESPHGDAKG